MPCILKIRIVSARNLPIMDRTTDLTDAFVEIKFSDYETYKTQTQRRSLNPVWNEDFRFEVSEDSDLQNEPLELKILDYDQITYHDSIGTVHIDLNPLLTWNTNAQISGCYDTLLGVRGELNAQVKLQFFGDINPFKDSSAGVQFFTLNSIPATHQVVSILGFVSAVDNEDDPEYHWSDNFRTPRTSNEARTRVMFRLSGHIRRQVGKKVLELNGNAVIGFKQYFDLESEKRAITARAIGTAVKLSPLYPDGTSPIDYNAIWTVSNMPQSVTIPPSSLTRETIPLSPTLSGVGQVALPKYSKSPQSDPPLRGTAESPTSSTKELFPLSGFKSSEPMLITLQSFPPGTLIGTGGLVSATSIKLIDNDERAVREAWWTELRDEIKSHARALSCPFIIGYSETTSINEELAVLHCSGTAAWIDLSVIVGGVFSHGSRFPSSDLILDRESEVENGQSRRDSHPGSDEIEGQRSSVSRRLSHISLDAEFKKRKKTKKKRFPGCQTCHITYPKQESPFPMAIRRCLLCKKNYVPEILLATIEPPVELKTIGEGRLVEAHGIVTHDLADFKPVCRQKKIRVGDTRAIYVSESIPFCQYDIHRQLTHKLRIYGLNAIFGLKIQFSVGESLMTAVATGTAVYVRGLPAPPALKVLRNLSVLDEEDKQLLDIQKTMMRQSEVNRQRIELALAEVKAFEAAEEAAIELSLRTNSVSNESAVARPSATNDSDSESSSSSSDETTLKRGLRSSAVVQIDDEHDEDLILLMEPDFPDGFSLCNTELPPVSEASLQIANSYNIQMMTVIKQSNINMISHHPNRQFSDIFKSMYQDLQSQVAYFQPRCIITGIKYDIHLPKDNLVQISMTAVAMGQIVNQIEEETAGYSEPMEVLAPLTNRPGFLQSLGFNRTDTTFDISSFRQMTRASLADTFEGSMASVYDDLEVFQIEEDGDTNFGQESHENPENTLRPFNASKPAPHIEITPLSYIPQSCIKSFLGRISLHFVKEATVVYETGTGREGMGGFTHVFLSEMYAITRAHASALGGNGVLAFSLDQVTVVESIRNQAYALVSLSGDVVLVEYDTGSLHCQTTFAQRMFGKV